VRHEGWVWAGGVKREIDFVEETDPRVNDKIDTAYYAKYATRKLQATDSSATMAYYSSLVYLVAALVLVPLTLMIGKVPDAPPSLAFLFRAWAIPTLLDGSIMCGLGLVWLDLFHGARLQPGAGLRCGPV
jgi:hypothetical protein